MDYPLVIFVASLLLLWLTIQLGLRVLNRRRGLQKEGREDFGVILSATLTLLALIIGFSFSMALNRYDQRKTLEEAEANAIGTEYVRADLLPVGEALKVRTLLRSYLDQRVLFYTTRDETQLRQIAARTATLQDELWSAVVVPAKAAPTPLVALAVNGMNDVLNSQGYTQAAWLNRIPIAAWVLMAAIAACGHLLLGYGAQSGNGGRFLHLVLPLLVSVSFFFVADIDSPRRGVIRVTPQNLVDLGESLQARP